jgi:hypothetical protein
MRYRGSAESKRLGNTGLDNWLIDGGGKVVSNMHQSHFTPQKHYFSALVLIFLGARGSLVVKALGYKPEDRGLRPDEVRF